MSLFSVDLGSASTLCRSLSPIPLLSHSPLLGQTPLMHKTPTSVSVLPPPLPPAPRQYGQKTLPVFTFPSPPASPTHDNNTELPLPLPLPLPTPSSHTSKPASYATYEVFPPEAIDMEALDREIRGGDTALMKFTVQKIVHSLIEKVHHDRFVRAGTDDRYPLDKFRSYVIAKHGKEINAHLLTLRGNRKLIMALFFADVEELEEILTLSLLDAFPHVFLFSR